MFEQLVNIIHRPTLSTEQEQLLERVNFLTAVAIENNDGSYLPLCVRCCRVVGSTPNCELCKPLYDHAARSRR
jgi:hypothetical protein